MILLTGATGFLGSYLLRELLRNQRFDVVCIKRKNSNCRKVIDIMNCCYWFDSDIEDLENLFKRYQITSIIHCATVYGKNDGEYFDVVKSNLVFSLQLVELATKYNCKYFINSDSFYTREINNNLWENNYRIYLDEYVKTKYIFKNMIHDHIDALNLCFINMQLEHIYGAEDRNEKFVNWLINSLQSNCEFVELTQGIQTRDWTYIDDVVNAYLCILDNLEQFNINKYYHFEVGTGVETSLKEFAYCVKKITKSVTKLKFGERKNMSYGELMHSRADNEELKRMGWNPCYNIEEGIMKVIEINNRNMC